MTDLGTLGLFVSSIKVEKAKPFLLTAIKLSARQLALHETVRPYFHGVEPA